MECKEYKETLMVVRKVGCSPRIPCDFHQNPGQVAYRFTNSRAVMTSLHQSFVMRLPYTVDAVCSDLVSLRLQVPFCMCWETVEEGLEFGGWIWRTTFSFSPWSIKPVPVLFPGEVLKTATVGKAYSRSDMEIESGSSHHGPKLGLVML